MTADVVHRLWSDVGGDREDLGRLTVQPCPGLLPTAFRVGDLATAVVGTTLLAADGFRVDRGGSPEAVDVDEREAVASFASERLLRVDGRPLGSLWADLSGDYRAADGWVRLHCNFPGHRDAALEALGEPGAGRDGVAAAVAGSPGRRGRVRRDRGRRRRGGDAHAACGGSRPGPAGPQPRGHRS